MTILIFLMDKKGFYVTSTLKPLKREQETILALQSSIKPQWTKANLCFSYFVIGSF